MTTRSNGDSDKKHWEFVHVCPKCAFVINLSEIDLRTVTTGIVDSAAIQLLDSASELIDDQ